MKKHIKTQKVHILIISLFILFLTTTIGLTFAYFVSSANTPTKSVTFGIMELDSNDFSRFGVTSADAVVYPGQRINFSGGLKLTNESDIASFVRLKVNVKIVLKSGQNATSLQTNQFLSLINSAFTKSNVWLKNSSNDGYLYYVGKFIPNSGTASGTRIVKSYNFSGLSCEMGLYDFKDEWQGATVTISLTAQAIQASNVGIDDVSTSAYSSGQTLVNKIAGIAGWATSFN